MKPKTMGWAGGRVILAVAQLTQRNRHGRSPSHHGGAKSWSSIDPWLGRFLWYPHDLGNSMDIGMLPCSFLGIHGCMFNFYGICAPPLPTSDSSCLTHLWQRHLETCSCQSNPRVDKKPSGYSGLSMTFPLTCPFGDFPSSHDCGDPTEIGAFPAARMVGARKDSSKVMGLDMAPTLPEFLWCLPSGNGWHSYRKWPIYSVFTH